MLASPNAGLLQKLRLGKALGRLLQGRSALISVHLRVRRVSTSRCQLCSKVPLLAAVGSSRAGQGNGGRTRETIREEAAKAAGGASTACKGSSTQAVSVFKTC